MARAITRLPVVYISHGSPESGFVENDVSQFWRSLGRAVTNLPSVKCILSISAHWEENPIRVNSTAVPETIYDFYGFPRHYYDYKYPAKGSPEVANRIHQLLSKRGIQHQVDPGHGLDHGTWVPLKWMLPHGSIPVVQLSLLSYGSMKDHIEIGKALAPLRDEGVLIVASGTSVHNMMDWRRNRHLSNWVADYVAPFDSVLDEILLGNTDEEQRVGKLTELENHPLLRRAHPSLEHLLPLHVAGGAAGSDPGRKLLTNHDMSFSLSSYVFGHGILL